MNAQTKMNHQMYLTKMNNFLLVCQIRKCILIKLPTQPSTCVSDESSFLKNLKKKFKEQK